MLIWHHYLLFEMLALDFFFMLCAFYVLVRVCNKHFISSLDSIADRLNMSSDAAGATLMAIGSSMPELCITIIALLKSGDHGSIGVGTIVGSALFNVLVIIGAAVVVRASKVLWQPIIRDMFFYIITLVLLVVSFWDGKIEWFEAAQFVCVYIVYVVAVLNWKRWLKYSESPLEIVKEEIKVLERRYPWKYITLVVDKIFALTFPHEKYYLAVFFISLAWISLASWVLVESAIVIAGNLGVPEVIIALTFLAVGTSIPDTISGVIVAKEGRVDMAISNAIGSNIFNILFALGIPWLILFAQGTAAIPVDSENLLSSLALLLASVFVVLFLLVVKKWRLGKGAGFFLIGLYVVYLMWLVVSS